MAVKQQQDGRWRSIVTEEEREALLSKELETLTDEEREVFELMLQELQGEGEEEGPSLLGIVSEQEFEHPVVDIEQFIDDEYYLGVVGAGLYPKLREDLIELFTGDYQEVVLTGAVGWGKSYLASLIMLRMIYELCCMRNPQVSYGLSDGSPIFFVNYSVTHQLAKKVVFESVLAQMEKSPFFQEVVRPRTTRGEISLPSKHISILPRASNKRAALGLNVFGGVLDECVTGDTLVDTREGGKTIESLIGNGGTEVRCLNLESKRWEWAPAYAKQTRVADVFKVELEDGRQLRATDNHPFLVVTATGQWEFRALRELMKDDRVVVDGQKTYGYDEREDPKSNAGQSLLRRDEEEDERGGEEAVARRSVEGSASYARRGQSAVRKAADRGDEAQDRREESRQDTFGRSSYQDVVEAPRQADAHRGVQAATCGEKPKTQRQVSSYGGDEAEDFAEQRLENETRTVGLFGLCRDIESGVGGVQELVGEEGYRDTGAGSSGGSVSRGEGCGTVCIGGQKSVDAAGFQSNWQDAYSCGGSQAERLHEGEERDGEAGCYESFLSRERMGLRDLDRGSAVGKRIRSIRLVGREQTYDLMVPGYENFVANGFVVHNSNFVSIRDQNMGAALSRWGRLDAGTLYNSLLTRIKSRFMRYGRVPGMLITMSSKTTDDAFVERKIIESRWNHNIFVRDYSHWDVRMDQFETSKWFKVLVGRGRVRSRILKEGEDAKALMEQYEGTQVIDAPEEFRPDFESNLEDSLRDLGGVSTETVRPYLHQTDKVHACFSEKRYHPMNCLEMDITDPHDGFIWDMLIEKNDHGTFQPIVNPEMPRHIHIDPALLVKRGDAVGLAMGHIRGIKTVVRRSRDGTIYTERAPIIYVDLMLRIIPPRGGGEATLGDIRRLIYELRQHGFPIRFVSMDKFQSIDGLQKLRKKGFETAVISVDKTADPYDGLKAAFYEGRLDGYYYPPVIEELMKLEWDDRKQKVDHPPKGKKDIADALAGMTFSLTQQQQELPVPPQRGISEQRIDDDSWVMRPAPRNPNGPEVQSCTYTRVTERYLEDGQDDNFLMPIMIG